MMANAIYEIQHGFVDETNLDSNPRFVTVCIWLSHFYLPCKAGDVVCVCLAHSRYLSRTAIMVAPTVYCTKHMECDQDEVYVCGCPGSCSGGSVQ